MSPRPVRDEIRTALLENAARLLAEDGPVALSTRRLASETGVSTTAVYTYFGGMPELVRAVVHEGFARLDGRLTLLEPTKDPLLDATKAIYVFRENALADPHIYRVMFGGSAVAGFELSLDDRKIGLQSFRMWAVESVRRLMAEGLYSQGDPWPIALGLWSAVHGHVMLDMNGYFLQQDVADTSFDHLVFSHHLGAGCPAKQATAAIRRIRQTS
ncbi:TetR/AcrR family transcriptional regulator [Kribbella sp. CA-294648]|uniref:TetR/AcrR family transcriptional regulator n=1 Tax=Kribbella sp. CA-294648 TaxID=3239948 RepID=UPI003D8DD363